MLGLLTFLVAIVTGALALMAYGSWAVAIVYAASAGILFLYLTEFH